MLTVKKMIQIIRSTVHDTQELEYDDDQIIGVINSGIRFIRRQIKNIRPQMLIHPPIRGTVLAGAMNFELPIVPTKIIDIFVDGSKLIAVNFLEIDHPMRQGSPALYYLTGQQTMNLYPIPNVDMEYMVRVVGSANELDIDGQSPLSDDLDDFIIEYACIRLSFANEFDMSQETQLLGVLIDQIKSNILNIEEPHTVVAGYFDAPVDGVRGYW